MYKKVYQNLSKMSFTKVPPHITGMKGSYVLDSSGDVFVDLATRLVRGGWSPSMEALFEEAINLNYQDAFVLAFQTRDVRGGKGERKLFTQMMTTLIKHKRRGMVVRVLDLIPEYGCWRDLYELPSEIHDEVLDVVAAQLMKDKANLNPEESPSLCAKWAPREGKNTPAAKRLALKLFPEESSLSQRLKRYRHLVAGLNRRIDTTEIKMCAREFSTIEPAHVPGVCLSKHMRAFLNERVNKHSSIHGLRYPTDKDRMECRKNFQDHMIKAVRGDASINGSVTRYPHQVLKDIARGAEGAERDSLIAVWNGIVRNAKSLGGLSRTLAMCDFSGSMQMAGVSKDTPFWVSMAMGLLISEVTSSEFKDTFLSFDSQPLWHTLPEGDIFRRLKSIGQIGQGTSTDFQKAMDLVLGRLKERRVRPGDEPLNLIVITDMAWDAACSSSETSHYSGNSYRHVVKTSPWQTHISMIREAFKRAGEDMWGAESGGWTPPRIVIWNVAATCADFHASDDTDGVIMISGWSPSVFKMLMEEGPRCTTPREAIVQLLDDERYDPIRARLQGVNRR